MDVFIPKEIPEYLELNYEGIEKPSRVRIDHVVAALKHYAETKSFDADNFRRIVGAPESLTEDQLHYLIGEISPALEAHAKKKMGREWILSVGGPISLPSTNSPPAPASVQPNSETYVKENFNSLREQLSAIGQS